MHLFNGIHYTGERSTAHISLFTIINISTHTTDKLINMLMLEQLRISNTHWAKSTFFRMTSKMAVWIAHSVSSEGMRSKRPLSGRRDTSCFIEYLPANSTTTYHICWHHYPTYTCAIPTTFINNWISTKTNCSNTWWLLVNVYATLSPHCSSTTTLQYITHSCLVWTHRKRF